MDAAGVALNAALDADEGVAAALAVNPASTLPDAEPEIEADGDRLIEELGSDDVLAARLCVTVVVMVGVAVDDDV